MRCVVFELLSLKQCLSIEMTQWRVRWWSGIKCFYDDFGNPHVFTMSSALFCCHFLSVAWKQTGQACMGSILCLFVVLVVWLTCLAPVTLAELRSVTLLAGIVNPAGVCDSSYLMPEPGSVRLISAWQPTWEVELRSDGQLIADS